MTSRERQRFYYAQAEYYIRRINAYKPLPVFVLYEKDIPDELIRELDKLGKRVKDKIITDVVRGIYQSVDPDYFAVNGVYGKVKYHMMEDTK